MHLRDAAIGQSGALIVAGRLDYPPDLLGKFPSSPGETQFQIARVGWNGKPIPGIGLQLCDAARDDQSGFLRVAKKRLVLGLPGEFGATLIAALRRPPDAQLQMTLTGQSGSLTVPSEVDPSVPAYKRPPPDAVQTLSNWTLHLAKTADDFLHVELTAVLLDLEGKKLGHREAPTNFWGNGKPEARLSVSFTLDPVTRVAAYGGYATVFDSKERLAGSPPRANSLSTMRLADATIGYNGQAHGLNERGEWVRVSLEYGFHVSPIRSMRTDPFGFADSEVVPGGPGMEFKIDEATLMGLLSPSGRCSVNFADDRHAYVRRGWGPDTWRDVVTEAHLDFTVDARGLTLKYRAFAQHQQKPSDGEWFADSVTVQWETLLLRYPGFVRWAPDWRAESIK